MFSVTFLGHQGWLFRSGCSCIMVDPLLHDDFGEIHALGYQVYPPRVVMFDAFPAIDALVLSHEHDDHFDVPTLARFDRRIPIYLSAHSSSAAFGVLREMGFVVRPLWPGRPVQFGELEVVPGTGDHVSVNCADEWDALPYLVRDRNGDGSFFSMVDVQMLRHHVDWAKAHAARPGLVTYSNNSVDWSHMSDQPAPDVGTQQCLKTMSAEHHLFSTAWGRPCATLMCAGGFAFHGDRAWLNERVFWVDADATCRQLNAVHPDARFVATVPGQTFSMVGNRLTKVDASTPFLAVAPQTQWPMRTRIGKRAVPDYAPATGRYDLRPGESENLQEAMNELARALVGGILFRSLHSLLASEATPRKPTFALVLRHGTKGKTQVFEYSASACAFIPSASVNPREDYLGGWECWASDLLAVLRGDMGPLALMFGRARMWNALPQRFLFDLLEGFSRVSHPLSNPAAYLRSYQRLLAKHHDVEASIMPHIQA